MTTLIPYPYILALLWKRISIIYYSVDVKAMAAYKIGHLWSLIFMCYYRQEHVNYKRGIRFCSGSN